MQRSEGTPRTAEWLLRLAPPFLVAAFLRLQGLPTQVLVGDEIHAIRSVVTLPWVRLYRFHGKDHCLPLSALYRWLSDLGVGLSETVLRSPSILAGLLLLVLLPAAAACWGSARTATIYAWLLAFAPSLVYYSRIARPYAPAVLLAILAAASFWRWYRGGGHRWAVLYAVAGGLALWLHLGFAPFVGAAPAFGAADWLRGGDRGRSLPALVAAAAGLTAAVALIVLPVWRSFRRVMKAKSGEGEAIAGVVADVLRQESGSPYPALTALFWLAALGGLGVLLRRRPRVALFSLTLIIVQWLAILGVLQPWGIHRPQVLARYVLVAVPVVLLWLAYGLDALGEWTRRRLRLRAAGWLVPAASVAFLAAGSSIAADPWLRLGPFAGADVAVDVTSPRRWLPPERLPAAYRLVAGEPGRGAVVEAVTTTVSTHLDATLAVARHHHRPVVLAVDQPWLADPRVALRTVLPADAGRLCRSDARFVVLHRHWLELESAVDELRGARQLPMGPGPREATAETARLEEGMIRECGEPYLAAEERRLWDLARRRAVTPGRSGGRTGGSGAGAGGG